VTNIGYIYDFLRPKILDIYQLTNINLSDEKFGHFERNVLQREIKNEQYYSEINPVNDQSN